MPAGGIYLYHRVLQLSALQLRNRSTSKGTEIGFVRVPGTYCSCSKDARRPRGEEGGRYRRGSCA